MSFAPQYTLGNYLPENVVIPHEELEYLNFLKRILEDHARFINRKETGSYDLVEQVINQQFFGANPQTKRNVYRKTFAFGAIAAGGNIAIAHNIVGLTTMTNLFGTLITSVPDQRLLPSVDVTLVTNQAFARLLGANIVIYNGATAPNITSGIVTIEYLKT